MKAELGDRWLALMGALQLSVDPTAFDVLVDVYSQDGRYYHNLDHIEEGLNILDQLGAEPVTKLAFWWHDYFYNTSGEVKNEEASAILMNEAFRHDKWRSKDGIFHMEEATRLIMLTVHHQVEWYDRNGCHMVVADLARLAVGHDAYAAHAFNIRKEYGQYSDAEWREGRISFIEGMLARASIFPPVAEFKRIENWAEANLRDELKALYST